MNQIFVEDLGVQPVVIARQCGGWLARTPASHAVRMGVIAGSEEEVRAKFRVSLAAWEAIPVKSRPGV